VCIVIASRKMASFNRLKNNASFLRYLHTANLRRRKQLLKSASAEELKSLCECAFNIILKNVPISPKQLAQLKKPKTRKLVYQLADKRIPLEQKRELVVQSGGFLGLAALLGPIIASFIGGAIGGH
jgi:hypothetical protein